MDSLFFEDKTSLKSQQSAIVQPAAPTLSTRKVLSGFYEQKGVVPAFSSRGTSFKLLDFKPVASLTLSFEGRLLLLWDGASYDLLDLRTNKVTKLDLPKNAKSLQACPDKDAFALLTSNKLVKYGVPDMEREFICRIPQSLRAVAFQFLSEEELVILCANGTLCALSRQTGSVLSEFKSSEKVTHFESRNGIVYGTSEHSVFKWTPRNYKSKTVEIPEGTSVTSLGLTANYVYVGHLSGTVSVFTVDNLLPIGNILALYVPVDGITGSATTNDVMIYSRRKRGAYSFYDGTEKSHKFLVDRAIRIRSAIVINGSSFCASTTSNSAVLFQ